MPILLFPPFPELLVMAAGIVLVSRYRSEPVLVAAGMYGSYAVVDFLRGWYGPAVFFAVLALGFFWLWRKRRGSGKRALRQFGAKSRARLAALVRAARERAVRRPVPVLA